MSENQRFGVPQTLPKSLRNPFKIDVPQYMQNLRIFLINFRYIVICRNHKNNLSIFHRKINNFRVFANIVFVHFPWLFRLKNGTKTLPKRGPSPLKIYAEKTCCFLTFIFSGFGPVFAGSWAFNLEPS